MPKFINGLELSGLFYEEVVGPLLETEFTGLVHSAALIGYGSEVLGYDTERSTDHEWGPRVLIFLSREDFDSHAKHVTETFSHKLPRQFRGYSTDFGPTSEQGAQAMREAGSGPITHKVEVVTVEAFFKFIGLDPYKDMEVADWLCAPEQKLLEATAGCVFRDGLGELEPIRSRLAYYPHDVWLYLLASQWRRIGQQEAFVGRAGEVGDELGSGLIAATLVRDLMRLCFLMERRYTPYSKWFGTAFSRLSCAPRLTPIFERALRAESWREREGYLSRAYEIVAEMHNDLGITEPLAPRVRRFFDRPYKMISAERFVTAISRAITDPRVNANPDLIGKSDQLSDSTDVLSNPKVFRKLRALYE